MISKKVPMRDPKKSSFGDLVKYLTDSKGVECRVGDIAVTNCAALDPEIAAAEVVATQAQNQRAKGDKTYHLMVSFREGENPTQEQLKEVERRMCEALGYEDHQRISVVHRDTDNVHIHIAINKIHPTRLTMHEPYNDFRVRDEMCAILEVEMGFERDNHASKLSQGQARANDKERVAGMESLIGWVQRECLEQLNSATCWEEVHATLAEHGLEMKARGAGLVIASEAGVVVKASSVDRELGKGPLEERLGAFVPAPDAEGQMPQPRKAYSPDSPVRRSSQTTELYARYQAERRNNTRRTSELAVARAERVRRVEAAKRAAKLKRAALKITKSKGPLRAMAQKAIQAQMKAEIEAAHRDWSIKRERIMSENQPLGWQDWLRREAGAGNASALDALRARQRKGERLQGNTVTADAAPVRPGPIPGARVDTVTTKGRMIYRVANSSIRDDGAILKVADGATQNGIEAALRMAQHRYGNALTITGTDDFKEQVARIAARNIQGVTFTDEALERRRAELAAYYQQRKKESTYERREDGGRERRAEHRRRDGGTGQRAGAGRVGDAGRAGADRGGRAGGGGAAAEIEKPGIGGIGRRPPPDARNRLRDLSELRVVQQLGRGEGVLPGDVHDRLGEHKADGDRSVRRDVPGAAGWVSWLDTSQISAAQKYIDERNAKAGKAIDISKHRGYTAGDAGVLAFAGIRNVDGLPLALLKSGDEILVQPIDSATANRLRRVPLGDAVSVSGEGSVRVGKGRSR